MSTLTATSTEAERLLTAKDVSAMLGLATGTIYNLRSEGRFAPAIVIGKAVRWETADVLAWARTLKEGQAHQVRTAGTKAAA